MRFRSAVLMLDAPIAIADLVLRAVGGEVVLGGPCVVDVVPRPASGELVLRRGGRGGRASGFGPRVTGEVVPSAEAL
jgi:hypothetical protein